MQRKSTLMIVAGAALAVAFSALAALVPVEQGNNKADLATTARIRKEINAANNLSESVKNVEIITHTGKVTLRGQVDTAKDKRLIGEIAVRWAAPGNVDNQLEVKVIVVSAPIR